MIIVERRASASGWRVEREVLPESIGNAVTVAVIVAVVAVAIITTVTTTDINCTIHLFVCDIQIIAMRTNSLVLFIGLILVGCHTFGVTVDAKGERVFATMAWLTYSAFRSIWKSIF